MTFGHTGVSFLDLLLDLVAVEFGADGLETVTLLGPLAAGAFLGGAVLGAGTCRHAVLRIADIDLGGTFVDAFALVLVFLAVFGGGRLLLELGQVDHTHGLGTGELFDARLDVFHHGTIFVLLGFFFLGLGSGRLRLDGRCRCCSLRLFGFLFGNLFLRGFGLSFLLGRQVDVTDDLQIALGLGRNLLFRLGLGRLLDDGLGSGFRCGSLHLLLLREHVGLDDDFLDRLFFLDGGAAVLHLGDFLDFDGYFARLLLDELLLAELLGDHREDIFRDLRGERQLVLDALLLEKVGQGRKTDVEILEYFVDSDCSFCHTCFSRLCFFSFRTLP